MNDFRIVYQYKNNEKTKVINAENENNAQSIFMDKVKESAKQDIKIKDIRLIEPVTNDFIFDNEIVANFLQYYLEQMNGDEYEQYSFMSLCKTPNENTLQSLNDMQDFLKNNYITKVQIIVTGDKK